MMPDGVGGEPGNLWLIARTGPVQALRGRGGCCAWGGSGCGLFGWDAAPGFPVGVFGAGWPDGDGVTGDACPGAVVVVVAGWAEAGDAAHESAVGSEAVTCWAFVRGEFGDGHAVGADAEVVRAEPEVF